MKIPSLYWPNTTILDSKQPPGSMWLPLCENSSWEEGRGQYSKYRCEGSVSLIRKTLKWAEMYSTGWKGCGCSCCNNNDEEDN